AIMVERTEPRVTGVRASLLSLIVLLLVNGVTPADEPPGRKGDRASDEVLVAPGPKAEGVVNFLDRIRDGRTAAERATGDLLVRGRVSRVNAGWREGMAAQAPDKLPPPDWCQFVLVHKGAKRR